MNDLTGELNPVVHAQATQRATRQRNVRGLLWLVPVPILMALLGLFAYKPFYRLWCTYTGTGNAPTQGSIAAAATVHTGRFVTVFFDSQNPDKLPISFAPVVPSLRVEVGADGATTYLFENLSDRSVFIHPVHAVSPINAAKKFGMKVCFCFNDQVFRPHERKEFPIVFTLAPDLDERIHTVSLNYTMFAKAENDVDRAAQREQIRTELGATVVSPADAPAAARATDAR